MTVRSLTTGPDAEWVLTRSDRELALLAAGAGPTVGTFTLAGDDVDLAIIHGPPNVILAATRHDSSTEIALHQPPDLDVAAKLALPTPSRIAALCAGRIIMLSTDQREMTIVRAAGHGLSAHAVDLKGEPIEFVVGLERNQLVVSRHRKLEVWDAASGRPLRKLALDLPPPPRTIGVASGILWAIRPNTDEVLAYRLSDGRPFQHHVGAKIEAVVSHPGSPVIVFVTPRGLIRLHCFAHSLLPIESPWQPTSPVPLAQLVDGEDIALLGWPLGASDPWRVAISGPGAVPVGERSGQPQSTPVPAVVADKPPPTAPHVAPAILATGRGDDHAFLASPHSWRTDLASFAQDFVRGTHQALPSVAPQTELGELAYRLGLGSSARRALIALYAHYLIGEPMCAIASLARIIDDWAEPLGRGQLAALAMIERSEGKVSLAQAATDVLDGQLPRDVRLVGETATAPRAGLSVVPRDGRTVRDVEADLVGKLGRIAVIETARVSEALLEARLHGATAVAHGAPLQRPQPWPHGAGLVIVLDGEDPGPWLADAPAL